MKLGLFAILDDIIIIMDDALILTKIASKKTMGILADDLAINADKASGFVSNRELPVLWKISKASFFNKLIILPAIFLLSSYLPFLIIPILLCGGVYLCFEGAMNVYKMVFEKKKKKSNSELKHLRVKDAKNIEEKKIKSAIIIDFILSIEIIIIALGTVLDQDFIKQVIVVSLIAILATVGVYAFVALLVRMDDLGFRMIEKNRNKFSKKLGLFLVKALPQIIRILKFIGTIAMILVGGGIFAHNIDAIHQLLHGWPVLLTDFTVGITFGVVFLLLFKGVKKIFFKKIIAK